MGKWLTPDHRLMPMLGGELLLCDFKKLLNRNIWPQFLNANFIFCARSRFQTSIACSWG